MKKELKKIEIFLKRGFLYALGYDSKVRIEYLKDLRFYLVYTANNSRMFKRLDHAHRYFKLLVHFETSAKRLKPIFEKQELERKEKELQEMRIDITLNGVYQEKFQRLKKEFNQATTKKTLIKLLNKFDELENEREKNALELSKLNSEIRYYNDLFESLRRAEKAKQDIKFILHGSQL